MNSLSIYAPNDVPESIELQSALVDEGKVDIRIANSTESLLGKSLNTKTWKRGFLVMRNYLVPPGMSDMAIEYLCWR